MPRYTPLYRPPVTVNLPEGLEYTLVEAPRQGQWRPDLPVSSHLYGVIETADPIPDHQVRHFDLKLL
jgi:hypothetical protein